MNNIVETLLTNDFQARREFYVKRNTPISMKLYSNEFVNDSRDLNRIKVRNKLRTNFFVNERALRGRYENVIKVGENDSLTEEKFSTRRFCRLFHYKVS